MEVPPNKVLSFFEEDDLFQLDREEEEEGREVFSAREKTPREKSPRGASPSEQRTQEKKREREESEDDLFLQMMPQQQKLRQIKGGKGGKGEMVPTQSSFILFHF